MPGFAWYAVRSNAQVKRSKGFLRGGLLPDRQFTFWTMTAWESQEAMRAFMTSGAHMKAMPKLLDWCDEASVAHWTQEDEALPTWEEADKKMRMIGRASKVRHPSAAHAGLEYRELRVTQSVALTRK